jgi:hypothetical protein
MHNACDMHYSKALTQQPSYDESIYDTKNVAKCRLNPSSIIIMKYLTNIHLVHLIIGTRKGRT